MLGRMVVACCCCLLFSHFATHVGPPKFWRAYAIVFSVLVAVFVLFNFHYAINVCVCVFGCVCVQFSVCGCVNGMVVFDVFCCCCGGRICYFNILVHRPNRLNHFSEFSFLALMLMLMIPLLFLHSARPFFLLAQIVDSTSVLAKWTSDCSHCWHACVRRACSYFREIPFCFWPFFMCELNAWHYVL